MTQPTSDVSVIAELPELVKNQIAAGEVVERPASVVKELVENALDAGATRVRVDLEEGGTRLVRVIDDGCGMGPTDLGASFTPHATSKLRSVEDLDHIASLGFRGEALASIGSVARCRVVTRPGTRETGFTVENDGGRLGAVTECGAPAGTTIEVSDLFFNTPARRRFLKRPSTELGRCTDILQRIALANETVGFVATHDGRRLFDVEPAMGLRDRVRRIFGAELADALVPFEAEDGPTRFHGLLAPPRFARRDASRALWFLNGRPLRDKLLFRALQEGFRGALDDHKRAVAFCVLAMDPAAVDVNVHPQKAEVRFREERRLFGFIVHTVRDAVGRMDLATPGEDLIRRAAEREGQGGAWLDPTPRQGSLPNPGGFGTAPREPIAPPIVREAPGSDAGALTSDGATPAVGEPGVAAGSDESWAAVDDLRGPYVQVGRTYLLRALPDGFEIVDQHALHERLTFEELRAQVRGGRLEVQRLLVPELIELSRDDVRLVDEHKDALARSGLELEPFGETTVALQAVPARLSGRDLEGLVESAVEVLREERTAPEPERLLEEVLHRRACRSSIMAGDELGQDEIRSLLESAREVGYDQTCPHGRPTRVRFTLADLERAFHRR